MNQYHWILGLSKSISDCRSSAFNCWGESCCEESNTPLRRVSWTTHNGKSAFLSDLFKTNMFFPVLALFNITSNMRATEHCYELQGTCDDNANQEGHYLHKLHDRMLTECTTEGICGVLPIQQIQHETIWDSKIGNFENFRMKTLRKRSSALCENHLEGLIAVPRNYW